ncbi:ethanolamine permease [Paraliomyxa miuraensis]|uniref:ethanolamine permease n=1 Tax=Paraliomyxa miuraensis TaxID=376150 RepID=UPI002258B3BB|nr:ethanolamine permease [Paraliomyxa miuraensis]MCX4245209.1 ethanolamine permease [Paraliomyxa miuraensis]
MPESVEYEDVDAAYLEQRTLQRSAGPVLLWGLGVGYVISGDYFGWNFGLNAGGFGGLLIATAIMATLYVTMIFSIAELATAMPVAGGPYAFARRALGPFGGYLTGLAVTIEYVVAPAVIATGIGGYVAGMFAAPPAWVEPVVPVIAYVAFVGVNLLGSRTSLRLLLGITVISVVVLLLWVVAVLPHVDWSRLLDVPPEAGGSWFLPHGPWGVLAALPAAGWFYLAVEGVPQAAEETRDPARDLPRGMIAAMLSLVVLSALVLVLGPAAAGTAQLAQSANPLPAAIEAVSGRGVVYWITTVVGLAGLVASFFGIIFAYSRQIFALSRAGYFPRWLSRTNRRRAPHWALVIPAGVGYGTILVVDALNDGRVATGDLLMQVAVFAALLSYVAMMVSHLVLRRREPRMPRPYRTPGYPVTPIVALVLSLVAMSSSLFYGGGAVAVVLGTAAMIGVGLLYFGLYSRHHLVAHAPEEEASLVRAAEAELDGP